MQRNRPFWVANSKHMAMSIIVQCYKFFQISCQKCNCIYVLQLCAKFYPKIPLGKWFFKFWSHYFYRETKNLSFGCHFKTKHFLIVLYADIGLFWKYTHMVQVSYQNSYRKAIKNECVQVSLMKRNVMKKCMFQPVVGKHHRLFSLYLLGLPGYMVISQSANTSSVFSCLLKSFSKFCMFSNRPMLQR